MQFFFRESGSLIGCGYAALGVKDSRESENLRVKYSLRVKNSRESGGQRVGRKKKGIRESVRERRIRCAEESADRRKRYIAQGKNDEVSSTQ